MDAGRPGQVGLLGLLQVRASASQKNVPAACMQRLPSAGNTHPARGIDSGAHGAPTWGARAGHCVGGGGLHDEAACQVRVSEQRNMAHGP